LAIILSWLVLILFLRQHSLYEDGFSNNDNNPIEEAAKIVAEEAEKAAEVVAEEAEELAKKIAEEAEEAAKVAKNVAEKAEEETKRLVEKAKEEVKKAANLAKCVKDTADVKVLDGLIEGVKLKYKNLFEFCFRPLNWRSKTTGSCGVKEIRRFKKEQDKIRRGNKDCFKEWNKKNPKDTDENEDDVENWYSF